MYASAAVVMVGVATTLGANAGLRHSLYQAMADLGTQIWKVKHCSACAQPFLRLHQGPLRCWICFVKERPGGS